MRALLERWFRLRADEYRKLLLAFSFAFGTAASYVVARSVAGSLFLKRVGIDSLPLMYIVAAIVVGIASLSYSRLATWRRLDQVIRLTVFLLAAASMGMGFLLQEYHQSLVIVAGVYLLAEVRGALSTIQLATLINELFSNSDPKRVLGLIGAGSTLAGVIFGGLVGTLATSLGTANLLFVIAGIELLILVPLYLLPGTTLERPRTTPTRTRRQARYEAIAKHPGAGLRTVLHSPYARAIAALTCVVVIVVTVVQYQWQVAAARAFADDEDALTRYFSYFFAAMYALTGLTQVLFTGRFLRAFGMLISLLMFPLALLGASFGILAASALGIALLPATLAKGCDLFRRTVHDPSVQVLYWPMPSVPRRQVVAFVGGIAKPFSEALAGFILLHWVAFGSVRDLSFLVLAFLGVWFILVHTCRRNYMQSLSSTIREGRVDMTGGTLPPDQITVMHLERALGSDDPFLVQHALELLPSVPRAQWGPVVVLHLFSESPSIRKLAVEYLGYTGDRRYARAVKTMLADEDKLARISAISSYCRLQGSRALEVLQPLADDPDPMIAAAAMVSLARNGGLPPGQFTEGYLEEMAHHHNRHLRLAAIEIMASINVHWFLGVWQRLFEDQDLDVALAAVNMAGRMRHPELIQPLLDQLKRPAVTGYAISALAAYGEEVLPALVERLRDPSTAPLVRQEIAKVLRRIPSQRTVNLIFNRLDENEEVEAELILTLKKLCRAPGIRLIELQLERLRLCYRGAVERYFQHLALLRDIETALPDSLLVQALRERSARDVTRVLNVLSLLHPEQDLDNVIVCLHKATPRTRAIALELLSNSFDDELKPAVLAMADELPAEVKLRDAGALFTLHHQDLETRLRQLTSDPNEWVRATAINQVGIMRLTHLVSRVRDGLDSPSYLVRETAFLALRNLLSTAELNAVRARMQAESDPRMAQLASDT